MSSARSLLDRLEHPEAASQRDLPGDPRHLMDSVCRHLQVMLNTRQGSALTVPDYGTADFADISRGSEARQRIQEEIRRSIEKYEPRLQSVQVRFREMPDQPFTVHFDISGMLAPGDGQKAAVFRSVIEASGEIRVFEGD